MCFLLYCALWLSLSVFHHALHLLSFIFLFHCVSWYHFSIFHNDILDRPQHHFERRRKVEFMRNFLCSDFLFLDFHHASFSYASVKIWCHWRKASKFERKVRLIFALLCFLILAKNNVLKNIYYFYRENKGFWNGNSLFFMWLRTYNPVVNGHSQKAKTFLNGWFIWLSICYSSGADVISLFSSLVHYVNIVVIHFITNVSFNFCFAELLSCSAISSLSSCLQLVHNFCNTELRFLMALWRRDRNGLQALWTLPRK